MKMNKNDRQEAILRIIRENEITTQDDLVAALVREGLNITQATISRDVKELGIVKVSSASGLSKYSVLTHTGEVAPGRLLYVFSQSVISCRPAGNLVVIKTLPGMAQGAASALDSVRLEGIIGTIAGDDTVFVATEDAQGAVTLARNISELTIRIGKDS